MQVGMAAIRLGQFRLEVTGSMITKGCLTLSITLSTLLLFSLSFGDDGKQPPRPVPEIAAFRIQTEPPVIDGNPDEAVWKSSGITYARNFLKMRPDEGKPSSESTVVAVLYDDQALYIAFWCYDSQPDKIKRQLDRRDRSPTRARARRCARDPSSGLRAPARACCGYALRQ